jgi:hypothetical protein
VLGQGAGAGKRAVWSPAALPSAVSYPPSPAPPPHRGPARAPTQVAKAVREADAAKAAGSPGHWIKLEAADGRPYFWNKLHNVSK